MIDSKRLLADLERLLASLENDLRERATTQEEVDAHLREEFRRAKAAARTGASFETWREELLTQVAVAWILGTVFVRFLEDNELVEVPRLSGAGERHKHALDQHTLYFQKHPTETDREYLLDVFRSVRKLPAAAELFDEKHNPLWLVGLSGDGATELLQFWQRVNPDTGTPDHDFTDPAWSTRFLGDLYQDLSEAARKKYALLQTPEFVEEFILDRTLTPAIETFGYKEVKLIDPACGSGHFLLGAFHRLLELRLKHEPGVNPREQVQRALDQVYGVDVNPFAVAIARFRLLLAALEASDEKRLAKAPGFRIHLAAGDSLLHGPRPGDEGTRNRYLFEDPLQHVYEVEDAEELKRILGERYHAVVGNPPYITVKDKALNAAYRERFGSCHQKYSLVVPFVERFFDLAIYPENGTTEHAGYVGMIVANSFMKREFGKKLIEEFIPKWDLTHVIDTSGAYIPGHGTPTVILFGRHRGLVGDMVRAVMGIRGEPKTPEDPRRGLVWSAILEQIDTPNSTSDFVSTADTAREIFRKHPWSLGGGGAAQLKSLVEDAAISRLGDRIESIGFMAITAEDDAYVIPTSLARRAVLPVRPFGVGDSARDWCSVFQEDVIFPYDEASGNHAPLELVSGSLHKHFWPLRTTLRSRSMFGKSPEEHGFKWYEYLQFIRSRVSARMLIAFAFVATHNHFVLDRGGKVFNRSAPVIKLPTDATEDDHLALLGLLNSSTACFWMQQVFHNKGGPGGGSSKDEKWHDFYEHDGTKLRELPIPSDASIQASGKLLDRMARSLSELEPDSVIERMVPTTQILKQAGADASALRAEMLAQQEELDWKVYHAFGLTASPLVHRGALPMVKPGQRAFEIDLARSVRSRTLNTKWFERTGATPTCELPSDWPQDYRELVERRLDEIEQNKAVQLIEQPSYKRRWEQEPWEEKVRTALGRWLLGRLEELGRSVNSTLTSCAKLSSPVGSDSAFLQVAELYRDRPDFDIVELVTELVESEAVPFLPILRYKPSGLTKRKQWEKTWELQRLRDTEEYKEAIPVPPKYAPADFLSSTYWRLRGKLDVPKERFISFPHCERAADPSPVILWAGFNHLQRAQAIAAYYLDMKDREGWTADRLTPLLAGLAELVPWVKQWHNDPDPKHGERMGDYFAQFLNEEAAALGLTVQAIRAWTPPSRNAARARRKARPA